MAGMIEQNRPAAFPVDISSMKFSQRRTFRRAGGEIRPAFNRVGRPLIALR